jgi:GIY-YIG catalytic domain.
MTTRTTSLLQGCGFIYALADPLAPMEVRYVGKTSKELHVRLAEHITERLRLRHQNHRLHWIRKICGEGRSPIIWLLEVCPESEWKEREQFWIAFFRPLGQLTNSTDGGDCAPSSRPDVRAKISAAKRGKKMSPAAYAAWKTSGHTERTVARNKRGWTPQMRSKMVATVKGRPMTPAQRAAFDARKDEFVARTIERNKRGLSPASRAKVAASLRGRKASPETVAKVKASAGFQAAQQKLRASNERRKRPVVGDDGRRFESVRDACRKLDVSEFQFREALRHRWRCRGVRWTVLEPSTESESLCSA